MRRFWLFGLAALVASCETNETKRYAPISRDGHDTYYDRNADGVVDYELHTLGSGHGDADWALIDTKFHGRYDLLIHLGHVVKKERVDIPVPKHVKITPGKPPKHYMR